MRDRMAASAVVVGALLALGAAAAPATAAVGDTSVFAKVAAPGYPAHAYVRPDGRVFEGTYVDPAGEGVPSKVFEYSSTGAPLRSWTVPGQALRAEHGVQVATSDARGRLVLLDRTPARALLLDPETGAFTPYATFPDLKSCPAGDLLVGCELGSDEAPMANYATWLPDGRLLVTDYHQDVIWQVPPGGGRASIWFQSDELVSDGFGGAGIALTGDRRAVLLSQAGNVPSDLRGKLVKIPLLPDLEPGRPQTLWQSGIADFPDGIAVARSGNVYVALVGLAAQVAKVAPDGREITRFGTPLLGSNGSPIPFDGPSNARFLGTRILVANQSPIFGNRANQAILAIETGEEGVPELIPAGAGEAPGSAAPAPAPAAVAPRLRATLSPGRIAAGRRTTVRVRVTATIDGARRSVPRARVRLLGRTARTSATGRATLRVRATRAGRFRLSVSRSGYRSATATLRVRAGS